MSDTALTATRSRFWPIRSWPSSAAVCADVEDYAGKYPELADEIRDLLPAPVLLEQGKSADGDATGSAGWTARQPRRGSLASSVTI